MQTVEYGHYEWIDDFSQETIEKAKKKLWEWYDEKIKGETGVIYDFEWDIETHIFPTELANEDRMALTLRFKRDEV